VALSLMLSSFPLSKLGRVISKDLISQSFRADCVAQPDDGKSNIVVVACRLADVRQESTALRGTFREGITALISKHGLVTLIDPIGS